MKGGHAARLRHALWPAVASGAAAVLTPAPAALSGGAYAADAAGAAPAPPPAAAEAGADVRQPELSPGPELQADFARSLNATNQLGQYVRGSLHTV